MIIDPEVPTLLISTCCENVYRRNLLYSGFSVESKHLQLSNKKDSYATK